MELVFLGTGAGNGVPVFYCDCPVCAEAHASAQFRRTRSSVLIAGEKNYLIDAPPEISSQLLREKIKSIDGLFLTHSHHDHVSGMGDLEIYAKFHLKGRIPAFMSRETMEQLEQSYGSMAEWLDITIVEPEQPMNLSEFSITGLSVSHSPGTFGYLIANNNFKVAYIPDSGPLPVHTMTMLREIDRLILDATFYGENWYPKQHHTVQQAIDVGCELNVKKLYLTHLSMHYSEQVTNEMLEREIANYNGLVNLAYDGLRMLLAVN